MIAQKNVMYLQIGKNLAALKAGTLDDLADGQIAVVNVSNTIDDLGNAVTGRVKVVQKSGDDLLFSPIIDVDNITVKKAEEYAAATQQITAIGYNGTSGSLDVSDNTLYTINIEVLEELMMLAPHPYIKFAAYKTGVSATQAELATGLFKSLVANFSREPITRLSFERNNDATREADVASTSAAVVNGSKLVTLGATYTGLVVGDYLSLNGDVYKVDAVNGTSVTLDVEYQGDTATLATGVVLRITAANGNAANWGVKLTAVAPPFREGVYKYQLTTFKLNTQNFGGSTFTELQAPFKGVGTYEEVAEIEWFLQGNEGDGIRIDTPPRQFRKDATFTAGKGYDLITLEWNDGYHEATGNSAVSFKQLMIATHSDATATVFADLKTGFGIV